MYCQESTPSYTNIVIPFWGNCPGVMFTQPLVCFGVCKMQYVGTVTHHCLPVTILDECKKKWQVDEKPFQPSTSVGEVVDEWSVDRHLIRAFLLSTEL